MKRQIAFFTLAFFLAILTPVRASSRNQSCDPVINGGSDGSDSEGSKIKSKDILEAVKQVAMKAMEIPADREELILKVAEELGITVAELKSLISDSEFASIEDMIKAAAEKFPKVFRSVADRKIYSPERREALFNALRTSTNVVVFKLGENQDLHDFESVLQLAESLDAPIIVAPAFADIGTIPTRLDFLFKNPRVHVFAGESIQLTKNFRIINHGAIDKVLNPLVGLDEIFDPTDRVIVMHPKIRTQARYTGNYATNNSYFMTTGSMSEPIYSSKFAVGMVTDFRAAKEAEKNLGVMVISRGYRDPKLGFIGGSQGIAPRRALYTDEAYGNPAGLFDMGKIHTKDGIVQVKKIPAIIPGDFHLGITDPVFERAVADELVDLQILNRNSSTGELSPGPVELGAFVFHDLIDGGPNNHHTFERLVTRAAMDRKGMLDLDSHVQNAVAFIVRLQQLLPNTKFIVPVDNHGADWLLNLIQEGEFFKTHKQSDWPVLTRLMLEAIERKINPYERLFQYYGVNTDNVRFMGPQDNFRIGIDLQNPNRFSLLQGIEVGQHSHMGIKGAPYISIKGLLTAYGAVVAGHTHETEERGRAKRVGTGTASSQDYHRGPSGSDQSMAIAYTDTVVQILRLEHGSFAPNAPGTAPEVFYPVGFPLIKDRATGGASTDQFRDDPPVSRRKTKK